MTVCWKRKRFKLWTSFLFSWFILWMTLIECRPLIFHFRKYLFMSFFGGLTFPLDCLCFSCWLVKIFVNSMNVSSLFILSAQNILSQFVACHFAWQYLLMNKSFFLLQWSKLSIFSAFFPIYFYFYIFLIFIFTLFCK